MSARARGFKECKMRDPQVIQTLENVRAVLATYQAHLPLTIRQIYYRLVSNYDYDKTALAYNRLCEHLSKWRRGKLIPMDAIRDDTTSESLGFFYDSADNFMSSMEWRIEHFRLDRQAGQPRRLLLVCESKGMLPQIERVADPYGIPCASKGGFDSLTFKHDIARRLAATGNARILHIGDYDPSGVHIANALLEDVQAFGRSYGVDIDLTRLAVLPDQIEHYRLPTAPVKKTDNRQFNGEATVQAESLDPTILARIVKQGILRHFDIHAYRRVLEREDQTRSELRAAFASVLHR